MSNSLNYVQHIFPGGAKNFPRGKKSPCAPIATGLSVALQIGKSTPGWEPLGYYVAYIHVVILLKYIHEKGHNTVD